MPSKAPGQGVGHESVGQGKAGGRAGLKSRLWWRLGTRAFSLIGNSVPICEMAVRTGALPQLGVGVRAE